MTRTLNQETLGESPGKGWTAVAVTLGVQFTNLILRTPGSQRSTAGGEERWGGEKCKGHWQLGINEIMMWQLQVASKSDWNGIIFPYFPFSKGGNFKIFKTSFSLTHCPEVKSPCECSSKWPVALPLEPHQVSQKRAMPMRMLRAPMRDQYRLERRWHHCSVWKSELKQD